MKRLVRPIALTAALLVSAVACGPSTTTETIEDDGTVCLRNESGNISDGLEAGPTKVKVFFNTCLSSSCDTLQSKSCTATLNGSTVRVTSKAVVESDTSGGCTADCGFVEVTCDGPELSEGDFTLQHGTETTDFSVPSSGEVCGAGESPARP